VLEHHDVASDGLVLLGLLLGVDVERDQVLQSQLYALSSHEEV
jgi:hypothetical protein